MNKEIKSISIIGYGSLSKVFLQAMKRRSDYKINGILVKDKERKKEVESKGYHAYIEVEKMLADQPDYVVEFASGQAVKQYGVTILEKGIPFIIVSVGALADEHLYKKLSDTAKQNQTKLFIASGAIGGFDLMRTLTLSGSPTVRIENFKSPQSFEGAPHLDGKTPSTQKETVIFKGNAKDAIEGFPKNVNVAIAASLATVGTENSNVIIHSVPEQEENIHKITVENETATAEIKITSHASPDNPQSSTTTAWSVVALLDNLASPIQFF